MKLAICNDLHLDFLSPEKRIEFIRSIDADGVVIAGDLGNALTIYECLQAFLMPVYVVLGNHDSYRGSIDETRRWVAEIGGNCCYLSACPGVQLGDTTLIGVDSWCDGRLGDYANSRVELNDFHLITELARAPRWERLAAIQLLADDAAQQLKIRLALAKTSKVIVISHVSPFAEASMYRGEMSSPDFLPFYAWKSGGDILLEFANAHPDVDIRVFCGHAHGEAHAKMLPNLQVTAGAAVYGSPVVQNYLEV